MGAPRGSGWLGRRCLPIVVLLGTGCALLLAGGSTAAGPTIEAASSGYYFVWRPASATVGVGGAVSFKNPSASVPHGVTWTGGPAAPGCTGIPVDGEGTNWSGECTFPQAGNYTFICKVHPTEMKGTIVVGSTAPPPGGTPPPGGSTESPLQGSASQAVKVARNQHGSRVRGSVSLSAAGAGGKLDVRLYAKRAALSQGSGGGNAQVGRTVRSALKAGRVSFAVPLKKAGRQALGRLKKLSLSVKIVVTPPGGAAVTLKRGVVLHA
jgi:plastocyanin